MEFAHSPPNVSPLIDNFHHTSCILESAILSSIIISFQTKENQSKISKFVKTMLPKMQVMREVIKDNIEDYKKYCKEYSDKGNEPKNFEPE